ncbi:MAG: hypothetical protein J6D34_10840 [Atopobiaceae bacterium]|nr:hypothetical protein [Atopobiaceae bacterium]
MEDLNEPTARGWKASLAKLIMGIAIITIAFMLDTLKEMDEDYKEMLPLAMVCKTGWGALQTQIDPYTTREIDPDIP